MDFRTVVDLPARGFSLPPDTAGVMFLGSCFAQETGARMAEAGLKVDVNPFGVLYNPASIAQAIDILLSPGSFSEENLFRGNEGLWHSWQHSTLFSAPTREACWEKIQNRLVPASESLSRLTLLCVTWGTAHVFEREGHPVGNCHKQPAAEFAERRMTVDEIVASWSEVFTRLWQINSELRVVLSVSPYRYRKLGFHGSQLSKAILLLAVEQLCAAFPRCHYFPAYEIVLDELRDYRFFAPDMLHPSPQAADYVWQRFAQWIFTPETTAFAEKHHRVARAAAHRPLVE